MLILYSKYYLYFLVFKKFQARGLVHLGWCFYCLFMTLGFLLGAVLNPVSVASVEFCTYLDGFLHNETFFNTSNLIAYIYFLNLDLDQQRISCYGCSLRNMVERKWLWKKICARELGFPFNCYYTRKIFSHGLTEHWNAANLFKTLIRIASQNRAWIFQLCS